jgi:hypothetical protein
MNRSSDGPIEQWLIRVGNEYGKHGESAVKLGGVLVAARAELRRTAQWSAFLKSKSLPFSERKAQMLVRIHEQLATLDAQTFAGLPCGWSILNEISGLTPSVIEEHVRSGRIHPRLTLKQAKELIGTLKVPADGTAEDWSDWFRRKMERDSSNWDEGARVIIATCLQETAQALLHQAAMPVG